MAFFFADAHRLNLKLSIRGSRVSSVMGLEFIDVRKELGSWPVARFQWAVSFGDRLSFKFRGHHHACATPSKAGVMWYSWSS